jgi:hypothetical protein
MGVKLSNGRAATSWRAAKHEGLRAVCSDVCKVREIDDAGKDMLKRMSSKQVEFVVAAHATHAITQRSRLQHPTRLYSQDI